MKRILSLIISVLMFVTFVPTAVAGYTDTNERSVLTVSGLGLMEGYDDGTFLPENNITRAEFATIIANIYKKETDSFKQWQNLYFKDTEEELGLITQYGDEAKPVFNDVDSSHWAYAAVNTVYTLGFMEGVSKNEFDPDGYLTAPQIYKILSVMLGYRVKAVIKGGYPSGYIAVANETGLSDGISTLDRVSRADVAKILTNAFDIEMLYLSSVGDSESYETYKDKTFLTEIMGINRVRGIMTDNGLTTLNNVSSSFENDVIVGGVTIRINEDTSYFRDFIGRNVDIFYKKDKDSSINNAVYGFLNERDEIVSFDASDFVDVDVVSNTITYKSGEDTIKKLKLKNGASLIKNGMVVDIPKKEDFLVNKGTYTVVNSDRESAYDLILLDSYVSFYVDSVDTVNKKVYSLSTLVDNKLLDFSDTNKTYVIYDDNGEPLSFQGITQGTILSVSDSERIMKVYISTKTHIGKKIDAKHNENEDIILISEKTEYRLSKDFIELNGDCVEVGKTYTLYVDKFGEIINAVLEVDSTSLTALMVDIKNFGSLEEDYQMKYFAQDNSMKISPIASKVTFVNSDGVESVVKDIKMLAEQLSGYDELFRYKLNAEKEISYIELAQNQKAVGNPKNRLLRIKLSSSTNADEYLSNPYFNPGKNINGRAIVDSAITVAFVHPSDFSKEDLFKINKINDVLGDDSNPGKYIMAYTVEGDSPFANYIISKSDSAETGLKPNNKLVAIVKDIKKGLDKKGEPSNIITVYEKGAATETKLYCSDAVINDVRDIWGRKHSDYDEVNNVWTTDAEKYKIEMGDVIRYVQNSDGTLSKIYLMFDENAINPHSLGQGNIAGSYGYYDSTATDGVLVNPNVNSMPYAVREDVSYDDYDDPHNDPLTSSDFYSSPLAWKATELRSFLAYPVSATSNSLTVTTQDLSVKAYEYNFDETKYMQEVYKASSLVVYVIEGNKLYPVSTPVTNLKTYNLAGHDCDRIYMLTRAGSPNSIIAIRGKTTK